MIGSSSSASHLSDTINIGDRPIYEINDTNQDGKWILKLNGSIKSTTITSPYTRGQIHAGGESNHSGNTMNGEYKNLTYAEIVSGTVQWKLWDSGSLLYYSPYVAAWCTQPKHFRFATGSSGTCVM
jgi:hypothetical protein